jgi:uncharacterized membrane protein
VRISLILLLVVAFLPLPARLIAEARQEEGAVRGGCHDLRLTLPAIRLLGPPWMGMTGASTCFSQDEDREEPHAWRRLLLTVIGYVVAIVNGLVVARVAVALYFAITLYLIVPLPEAAGCSGAHSP